MSQALDGVSIQGYYRMGCSAEDYYRAIGEWQMFCREHKYVRVESVLIGNEGYVVLYDCRVFEVDLVEAIYLIDDTELAEEPEVTGVVYLTKEQIIDGYIEIGGVKQILILEQSFYEDGIAFYLRRLTNSRPIAA